MIPTKKKINMSRSVATADQFLTSPAMDRQKEDVDVPELGDGVVIPIWGMTPRERTTWEDRQTSLPKDKRARQKHEIRERLLVECCRDDEGKNIFTRSQIEQLGQRRADVVERLVNVALRLSGFNNADVEKLAKNSDASQDD